MTNATAAKVLIVEDEPLDAEMMIYELKRAQLCGDCRRVSERDAYEEALTEFAPDVILSDYSLPGFGGQSALALREELAPDTPFVIVSGSLGEERAVEILKAGATDYVLKHNLARLVPVVSRALADAQALRDRQRIARELDSERKLLATVLDTSAALVTLLDANGRIVRINAAAAAACGVTEAEAQGQHYADLFVPPGDAAIARAALRQILQSRRAVPANPQAPWREVNRLGRVILWSASFLDEPGLHGETTVLAGLDVTEHEAAKERAYVLSYYDPLTHLPNQVLFRDRLRLAQMRASANQRRLVLVLIGLGRLRDVRDSLGSRVADLLIGDTARRLQTLSPKEERLARIGDDSFALSFDIDAQADVNERVNAIAAMAREPHMVDGRSLVLAGHLGVAIFPGDGDDAGSLLQAADSALHRASALDEGGIVYYQPALYDRARERLMLEGELREALVGPGQEGAGLTLHYQPQIDLRSGRIVGAEALLRWQHPTRGLLAPSQFIALAEESELIFALGDWVLRRVCEQGRLWQTQGLPMLRFAVNLSARQFSHPDVVERIRDAVAGSGFDARRLELELTESVSMRDPEISIEVMHRLREMGLRLAIDDFGTGYSNLSYLKRFPVHALKLDRAFVKEITSDPDDFAISRAVVAIAHQLHLELIAEGVETRGQLALLADARCDIVQGYLVSSALPPEEFAALARSGYHLNVDGRQPYRRTLLSIEPDGGERMPLPRWLRDTDCELLRAESVSEAFELLATHEVGVLLSDLRRPTAALGAFLSRVHGMYPDVVCVTLSPEQDVQRDALVGGRRRVLQRSDERRLPAVIKEAFASYEAERMARH